MLGNEFSRLSYYATFLRNIFSLVIINCLLEMINIHSNQNLSLGQQCITTKQLLTYHLKQMIIITIKLEALTI